MCIWGKSGAVVPALTHGQEEVQSGRVCLDIEGHIGEEREGDEEGGNGTRDWVYKLCCCASKCRSLSLYQYLCAFICLRK